MRQNVLAAIVLRERAQRILDGTAEKRDFASRELQWTRTSVELLALEYILPFPPGRRRMRNAELIENPKAQMIHQRFDVCGR